MMLRSLATRSNQTQRRIAERSLRSVQYRQSLSEQTAFSAAGQRVFAASFENDNENTQQRTSSSSQTSLLTSLPPCTSSGFSSRQYSTLSRPTTLVSAISHSNHRLSSPTTGTTTGTTTTTSAHSHSHIHLTQIRTRVFVSRHNQSLHVTANDITEFFDSHGIATDQARTTASHVILRECPFCTKPVNHKQDNMYKCYVQIGGGAYFCHRCGGGGSWFDLKLQLGGFSVTGTDGSNSEVVKAAGTASNRVSLRHGGQRGAQAAGQQQQLGQRARGVATAAAKHHNGPNPAGYQEFLQNEQKSPAKETTCLPMPSPRLQACYNTQLLDQTPNDTLEYLQDVRGLTVRTLRKYGVGSAKYNFRTDSGAWEATECVTFPWLMSVAAVQFQESLRGATFEMPDTTTDVPVAASTAATTTAVTDKKTAKKGKASDAKSKKKTAKEKAAAAVVVDATPVVDPRESTFLTRRIKVRALANKAWQRLDPPGGGWGLFGFHTVPADSKEIILTEGEYDAMAVWQATGRPAVSLPNGCRSLPVEVLPQLEGYEKVYLWMDNDGPGQEGAELFAKKIGLERCYIVRPTHAICGDELPKDANEALLEGMDLQAILEASRLVPHERILTFDELRSDVMHEIFYPDKYTGVPMTSLPGLTSIIKGFRRGELTVITGSTGSGKTTFLGQMSLDLAEQGINVLWGSFEIKNTRLMHKLLQQFAREPLPVGDPSKAKMLEPIADKFSSLPLYFMKFHGGSDVNDVLDAMDYAVYVNDAEHIILDNMQFMISRKATGNSTFDKFDVQDMAIEKFRQFATDRNVHVTLVVHPRKEQEDSKLSMASIYGSAKATQEADTVLILQNDNRRKYIEVKKNRFNGALGHTPLHFNRESGRYHEEPQINSGGGDGGNGGNAPAAVYTGPKASVEPHGGSWDRYRK